MHARLAILAAAVSALHAPLLMADPKPLPDHRWSLRAEFWVNTPQDPLPGDAVLAVSLKRRLGTWLALEAALGPGLPVTTLKKGALGLTEVDLGSGLHGAALLRAERRLTSSGRTLLSLGAGPSFVSGDVFGTVPMARIELGFDWRFRAAGVFFASVGYESVLDTSRKPFEAAECVTSSGCPPHYRAGAGQVSTRWGFGFTF
jgi:hypothetical protein